MSPSPVAPPSHTSRRRHWAQRLPRPWPVLIIALLAVTALLAGCGLTGAASGLTASIMGPWLVLLSLVAFLVGCGGSNLNGGGIPGPARIASEAPAAIALKFITQPTKSPVRKAEALTPITPAPQVAVVDVRGAVVTSADFPITVSLDQNPGNAVLAGTTTVLAVNGVATFSDLRISRAASGYTLRATAEALTADTSISFTVAPLSPIFASGQARIDYDNGLPVRDRVNLRVTDQVVGDFNGDGHDDVAVAASYGSTPLITVMLGDGKGRLGTPRTAFADGLNSVGALVAVDADGDARDDLAFTTTDKGLLTLLRSNGDGTFAALSPMSGFGTPVGLVSGDFDRDGRADLVAGLDQNGSGAVSVMLGNGNGTFRYAVPAITGLPLTSSPRLTIGRFNSDAFDDLGITAGGSFQTLLGNGNGTFAVGVSYGVTGGGADALVHPSSARLDGDLLQDVLVSSGAQSLYALMGDGTGGFSAANTVPIANAGAAIALDLDGNGQAEIIANQIDNTGFAHTLVVQLDNGGQRFFGVSGQGATVFGAPPVLGDLNEDGRTDVVTSVLGATSVLLGREDRATFQEPSETALVSQNVVASAVVDADVDGTPDLLTAAGDAVFGFQHGLGNGAFGPVVTSSTSLGSTDMAVGDLNGDGLTDAVLSRTRFKGFDVTVMLNQGAGLFTPSSVSSAGYNTSGVTLADVNRDGRLDIVANTNTASGGVSEVLVMLGNGDGTFGSPNELATANTPTRPAVTDFNADGMSDIALSCAGGGVVQVLLGNGDGTFLAAVNVAPLSAARGVIVGDLDGNGMSDIAGFSDGGDVAVLLGNGDATFRAPLVTQAAIPLQNGVAVDFTADGKSDLVVASGVYSDVAVLTGNGDGTFAAPEYVGTANGSAVSVSVGDLDGDGRPDIVNANRGSVNSTVNLHR